MSDLSLQLFGSFVAELDGRTQKKFRTIKAPALLIANRKSRTGVRR